MENSTKSNDQLFSEYFDVITNTHSRASLYEAKRLLNHFKEFISNFPPTTELAAQFLGQYVDRKPNTKARYHFTVSAFFRWYSGNGLSFKVKTPKLVAHIVTDEEIERVIDSIKNKRSHKNSLERDILLIRMPIHTGLRRGEMANLMVGDLNLTGNQPFLTVKGGKGAKDRIVPLNNYIKELLANFTQGMAAEENILKLAAKTITLKISKWAHKAGVNKLTTHSLRHKFATDLLNKGANIKVVQELMGHESLETTQVYLSITDESLRKAVNTLEEPAVSSIAATTLEAVEAKTELTLSPEFSKLGTAIRPMTYGLFSVDIKSNTIFVENIEVHISEPDLKYKLMLFESDPKDLSVNWENEDLVQMNPVARDIYTYYPPPPGRYVNRNDEKKLHGGIGIYQRNLPIELLEKSKEKERKSFITKAVTLTITLSYRMKNN